MAAGRGPAAVLLREARTCVRDMWRAHRAAGDASTALVAPYWMLRRFLGLARRPLDSQRMSRLTFTLDGRLVDVAVRHSQSDLYILREIFLEHMYELDLQPAPRRLPVIVDCGANAGLSAAYLSARYRPDLLVAVEPIHESVRLLQINRWLAREPWEVVEAAVAPSAGAVDFYVSGIWSSCTAVERIGAYRHSAVNRIEPVLARARRRVPTVTMSGLMHEFNLTSIDLLKVDIEGGEEELLTVDNDWLAAVRRVVIEIHDKYIDGMLVRDELARAGLSRVPQHGPCELWVRTGTE